MPKSTARRSRRRSAGEGSVYRNGNRWRGAVTWTEPDGSQGRKVVSAATASEARQKLDDVRRELRLGTFATGPAVTVGEYLSDWIERHRARVRASTWATAEGYVRGYLIPSLGRKPWPAYRRRTSRTRSRPTSGKAARRPTRPVGSLSHP